MKAKLLVRTKEVRDDGAIVEIVVWEVPEPLGPCEHPFKYRLYFGWPDRELVRYDNERLLDDFELDIASRGEHEGNR